MLWKSYLATSMRSPIVIKLNRTMKKVWFMFAMLVCVLASCSGGGEDDPITPTPNPEVIKSEITIDSSIIANGLSFTHEKGEQSISFSTNENWTLSVASTTSGATWCTASSTSGTKGTANVKFTVTENTDYDNRSVSVTIKSGTASKTFTVSQKCADALLVTTDKYEVSQEGGTIDIEVKANIEYKMEISEEAKDWITESSGRGLTPYKHTLNISMNEEKEKRQGKVYFKSGDKEETVTIYQAGGAILLLLQDECHVSDKGSTISVNVQSNIEFGVQMPDVDWIVDEASSRGLSSHTLKYVIKANEGYDSRSASIVFFDKNSSLKDTLQVIQAQKDAIVVAKNEYIIESAAGDLKFEVNTNVDFEVSSSVDWIKQNTESRGLEAKPLSFAIEENTSEEDREGLIVMSSGELKQEIKVIQKAKPVFSLSETEFNISSVGGEFEVKVSTNGEYSITMPDADWLTENKSRATASYTHTFTVLANETYDARDTEIIFIHKETNEVVKVKVVQAQKDAIIIAKNEYTIEAASTILDFEINTNVDFKVETSVDWIIQNTESRGLETKPLSFTISENTADEAREGLIIFSSGELKQKIKVVQKATPVFSLSETEFTIPSDGGEFNIEVSTNSEYTITMPKEDWLIENKSRVTSTYTHTFIVSTNNNYDARETYIAFTHKETNKIIEVKVIQEQKDVIILSQKEFTIEQEGSTIEVKFNSNVDVEVQIPSDVTWITQSNSRALTEESIYLKVAENTDEGIRSANIAIINKESQLSEIIVIRQQGDISLVKLEKAGTLVTILGDDYLNITSLKIVGPINGTDILYLRQMLGASNFSKRGKLATLDLSEATIVEGGSKYYMSYYTTSNKIIGKSMFAQCPNLKHFIMPDNTTIIEQYAFFECTSLNSITIGKCVSSIGANAFNNCPSLTSIIIPNSVVSIGYFAFEGCSSLSSVIIGDGVTSIGNYAFRDCSSLTSLIIGDSVKTIGEECFGFCSSLTHVKVGNSVTSIGGGAFRDCSSLMSISIGSGVNSIGKSAFYLCNSLHSVYITDISSWLNIEFGNADNSNPLHNGAKLYVNNKELTELIIPKNIVKINNYAFHGCETLKKVTIGDNVTSIGKHAFRSCDALTSVSIGSGVITIGEFAFYFCDHLTSLKIGNSVTSIGRDAFSFCELLTNVSCYAITPPAINTSDFNSSFEKYGDDTILFVPKKYGSKYKSSSWGKYFTNIVEME